MLPSIHATIRGGALGFHRVWDGKPAPYLHTESEGLSWNAEGLGGARQQPCGSNPPSIDGVTGNQTESEKKGRPFRSHLISPGQVAFLVTSKVVTLVLKST